MASKRHIRNKECTGKVRYATTAAAVATIKRLQQSGRKRGQLTPYKCQHCKGYHFGHPPARVRRAIARQICLAA